MRTTRENVLLNVGIFIGVASVVCNLLGELDKMTVTHVAIVNHLFAACLIISTSLMLRWAFQKRRAMENGITDGVWTPGGRLSKYVWDPGKTAAWHPYAVCRDETSLSRSFLRAVHISCISNVGAQHMSYRGIVFTSFADTIPVVSFSSDSQESAEEKAARWLNSRNYVPASPSEIIDLWRWAEATDMGNAFDQMVKNENSVPRH